MSHPQVEAVIEHARMAVRVSFHVEIATGHSRFLHAPVEEVIEGFHTGGGHRAVVGVKLGVNHGQVMLRGEGSAPPDKGVPVCRLLGVGKIVVHTHHILPLPEVLAVEVGVVYGTLVRVMEFIERVLRHESSGSEVEAEMIYIGDAEEAPKFAPPYRSTIHVPFYVGEEANGILSIGTTGREAYDEDDFKFVFDLGAEAGPTLSKVTT